MGINILIKDKDIQTRTDEFWVYMIPHIRGFTNDCGHLVSSYGRVYNNNTKNLSGQNYTQNGYLHVKFRETTFLVHRLIMMSFYPIPNPEQYQVNHKDANKSNNNIHNLEWCTNLENMAHAYKNSLIPINEDHHFSLVSNDQVHMICQCLEKEMDYEDICATVGIPHTQQMLRVVSYIKCGKTYKQISKLYNFKQDARWAPMFTDDQVHFICKCLESGMSYKDILLKIQYPLVGNLEWTQNSRPYLVLSNIKNKHTFTNISSQYNI